MLMELRVEKGIRGLSLIALGLISFSLLACNQLQRPEIEPFYSVTTPPPAQELRWSNGKTPGGSDPARAAAPPETDLIRAIYEGLTDLDSRTLAPVPAAASSWRSSKDLRTWTFQLRNEAKWSNGEQVTAHDFVRSWKRLVDLGERTANNHLFQNISGMNTWDTTSDRPGGESVDFLVSAPESEERSVRPSANSAQSEPSASPSPSEVGTGISQPGQETKPAGKNAEKKFGVVAIDDHTLRVELNSPDKDFPKLVANPVFHPIFGDGANFETSPLDAQAPTNGAFRITDVGQSSITLEKSETYWKKDSVALSRVRLVAADTAEAALEAYRNGEVDVVTNVGFEPVGVKLLAPFDDFRRTPHNAVNFYEVNTTRHPFADRRIRQALALAIDREKLAVGDLQGTTQPAYAFSPLLKKRTATLSHDVKKANDLLENAGYPGGIGFPPIRLVINRNDVQQRVAASVTRMWKQYLNLDSVIIVKETSEMDEVRRIGDFDLIRRGVVLPTNDELVNLVAIHGSTKKIRIVDLKEKLETPTDLGTGSKNLNTNEDSPEPSEEADLEENSQVLPDAVDEALFEMTAIPLYFPTSYSLVKPYIRGFELNGLDAPSLKEVSIDNDWQPGAAKRESY